MQMNMNRREFLAAFGTVAAGAVLAGCGNSNATSTDSSSDAKSDEKKGMTLIEDGKLTVVAELGFAPFEYMDEKTGEPVGFDVDVINAVAEKMGLTASYLPNQKFDTLVPIIKQGGKADVSIAAVPYLDSNQAIVVAKGSSETEETLNDASKQVVCQGGTTGDEWIGENLPDAVRVPVDDVTAALTGVQTGLYQAMVVDLPVASYMLSQSFSDLEIVKEIPTGEQYGIAVSKDNPELTQAVNKALEDMKSDGTMKEIETKWFGSRPPQGSISAFQQIEKMAGPFLGGVPPTAYEWREDAAPEQERRSGARAGGPVCRGARGVLRRGPGHPAGSACHDHREGHRQAQRGRRLRRHRCYEHAPYLGGNGRVRRGRLVRDPAAARGRDL